MAGNRGRGEGTKVRKDFAVEAPAGREMVPGFLEVAPSIPRELHLSQRESCVYLRFYHRDFLSFPLLLDFVGSPGAITRSATSRESQFSDPPLSTKGVLPGP